MNYRMSDETVMTVVVVLWAMVIVMMLAGIV
jgi:hypothetical protein